MEEQLNPTRQPIEHKKSRWWLWVIIPLSILIIILLIFDFLFGGNFIYLFLKIKVIMSSDKEVASFDCNNVYQWKINHYDVALGGPGSELGTTARIIQKRELILFKGKNKILSMKPFEKGIGFPTGSVFLRSFIFGSEVIPSYQAENELFYYLQVYTSEINEDEFEEISICLNKNSDQIEEELDEVNEGYYDGNGNYKKIKIGWSILMEGSIKERFDNYGAEFSCEGGGRAVTERRYLKFFDVPTIKLNSAYLSYGANVVLIGVDGKTYELTEREIKGFDDIFLTNRSNVQLSQVSCTNSNGKTLAEFLASIPDRIVVLS
jgi:hypothetical protein|tara:strand:+ start:112 stop:1071 length:960 start_codon:yes stop_codon:yes gene_type:complete